MGVSGAETISAGDGEGVSCAAPRHGDKLSISDAASLSHLNVAKTDDLQEVNIYVLLTQIHPDYGEGVHVFP